MSSITDPFTYRRVLRPAGNSYAVLVEDEAIGTVRPHNDQTYPWRTYKMDRERVPVAFTSAVSAAQDLVHYNSLKLRDKPVRELTDPELAQLVEAERGVNFSISQSDAYGTARKIGSHQDRYLIPLYNECRRRVEARETECANALCNRGVVQYGEDTDSMTQCPDCHAAGRFDI